MCLQKLGCQYQKDCASNGWDWAAITGISMVTQVKMQRKTPLRWMPLWQEVRVVFRRTHSHTHEANIILVSRWMKKQTGQLFSLSLSGTTTKQQFLGDSYRERLMGKRFHCYGRPWHWSRFPQTGRRNRWPQNAPHWSSEIRRPWRLSYRPPSEGGGGSKEEGQVDGGGGQVVKSEGRDVKDVKGGRRHRENDWRKSLILLIDMTFNQLYMSKRSERLTYQLVKIHITLQCLIKSQFNL